MVERTEVVRESEGGSVAMLGLIAVIIVAAVVALFVWQPWNTPGAQHTTTTIVNPPAAGTAAGGSSMSSGASSGTSGSTTTSVTH